MEWRQVAPREAASLLLAELFSKTDEVGCPAAAMVRGIRLAEHQEAGVRRAQRVLDRRRGVLIADAVGLGKTHMALALIEEELKRGGRVLVAVPAALRDVWRAGLDRLARAWPDRMLNLTSHARLSRGTAPAAGPAGYSLVVVDEAHRFRNPATRRYAGLAALCAGSRLVLMTATPVNNRSADLHHLLRLFADDAAFHDLGVASLAAAFAPDPRKGTGVGERDAVRQVVRAVMIRRTRDSVAGTHPDLRFPARAAPRLVCYEDRRLDPLGRGIAALELAAYDGSVDSGRPSALVRLGLLKRLDSSTHAFSRSLEAHLRFVLAFLDAADQGRLVRPRDLGGRGGMDDGDPHQLALLELLVDETPDRDTLESVRRSVRRDLRRLRAMRGLIGDAAEEPKIEALAALCERLRREKVLVFTEYRDTAAALWSSLGHRFRVGRIDGAGAWLGRHRAGRAAVIERFAPAANGRPLPPERERVDVLIATDVLAEGLNLQDARHIVSYDLPWNPVRLLQRIGRIDRLGSPHTEVVPYLVAPPHDLDRILPLRRTLRAKLDGIDETVGSEAGDRLLSRLLAGGPVAEGALREIEQQESMPVDRLRQLWSRAEAKGRPPDGGCAVTGTAGSTGLVLVDHGGRKELLEWNQAAGTLREPGPEAVAAVSAALEAADGAGVVEAGPLMAAELARLERDVLRHFDLRRARLAAPPPIPPTAPAARLARRLRTAVHRTPAAHADLLGRADRLLARLEHPLPAVAAAGAREILAVGGGTHVLQELVTALERVVESAPLAPGSVELADGASPRHAAENLRLCVALLPAPPEPRRPVDEVGTHG